MPTRSNTKLTPYKRFFLLTLITSLTTNLIAQENDTLKTTSIEFITDQLENIAQTTDRHLDYSDLLNDYLFYFNNKISLNGENLDKLLELHLINENQLNNLKLYIAKYKQFYSIYELKSVPGFNTQTIQNLLPFITVNQKKEKFKLKPSNVIKYGKHQLILRYSQVLEPSMAYSIPSDSALYFPGSAYLGSPQALYTRYSFNYQNKIRLGLTLDKDAGEVFLTNQLNDSLKNMIGNKVNLVSDFYSAHVFASDLGFIKKLVIGDYHLEFGQGLTMWSGLAFGKSAEALQIKRFGKGIRPNTSSNENMFFRGAAVTLGWNGVSATSFYSVNKIDGSLNFNVQIDEEQISSIIETGKHRTINELLAKDAIRIETFGGRLAYAYNFFNIGVTAFKTRLSASMKASEQLYKQFYFNNDQLVNLGTDLNLVFKKFNLFGELAMSNNGGLAGLAGINTFFNDRFSFTIFYHNYGKDYHNLFSNPFASSNSVSNENGLYIGLKALLAKNISLTAYVDYFAFSWLRYNADAPSFGKDYLLQFNYAVSSDVEMYFRYRYRVQQENYSEDYEYTTSIENRYRSEFRFFLSYEVLESLIFKNRVDYVIFKSEPENSQRGYLIYQDILYRPELFPLEITFRYALFDTKGYDSRIYTYENDVLYAFSVPSYFDTGQRAYLMLRWKASKNINLWLRFARTVYKNRLTIGSGADEIDGNAKTEIKVQVQLKL